MLKVVNNGYVYNMEVATQMRLDRPVVDNFAYSGYYWTNDFRPGLLMDWRFTNWAIDFSCGPFRAEELLGWMPFTQYNSSFGIGDFRPETTRVFDSQRDWVRYGSILSGLLNLGKPATARHSADWSRESDTWHKGARGRVELGDGGELVYPSGRMQYASYDGTTFPRINPSGSPASSLVFNQVGFNGQFAVPPFQVVTDDGIGALASERFDARVLFAWLPQLTPFSYTKVNGYAYNELRYSRFETEVDDRDDGALYRLKYVFENWAGSLRKDLGGDYYPHAQHTYAVEIEVDVKVQLNVDDTLPIQGEWCITATPLITISRKYSLVATAGNHTVPSAYPWLTGSCDLGSTYASFTQLFGYRNTPLAEAQNTGPGERAFWLRPATRHENEGVEKPVEAFNSLVKDNLPDLLPIASLSANDCLSSYSSSSNWLESVPELPSMIRSIRNLSRFGMVLKALARGDVSAIPAMIDLLASGYLAWKYGARPGASDVREAIRIAREYWNRMESVAADLPRNLYGKYTAEIPLRLAPDFQGRFILTSRSKMVLRQQPSALLSAVLTMDDVGVLPTLARIWDLVPFSFVVDWFTSLSDRFEDIDRGALRAGLSVDYYVHTLEARYLIDPRVLHPYRSVGSTDAHLRVFVRYRSLYHPLFRESRFDFHPPRGLKKNLYSAGALLWVSR